MGRVLTNHVGVAFAVEDSLGSTTGTQATGVLTFSDQPANTETVVIGTKTYTFQTTLTEVDGNVLIGGTTADSIANLANAINLGAGAGTAYAEAMTANADVTAVAGATTLTVTAITGGTAGNSIASTDTVTDADWGDTVLGGGVDPVWKTVEYNSINSWGADITTTPRNPISKKRHRRKGSTTDLDSGLELEMDVTLDSLEDWLPKFFMASFAGAPVFTASAAVNSTSSFTVDDIDISLVAGDLIYVQGAVNSANNGLHVVDAGSTDTSIVTTSTLVDETLPANATLEKAGFRAAASDLSITSDGNLLSQALNFATDTEIEVGQTIHIGGSLTANRFTAVADHGYARVISMATTSSTNDTLVLDKANSTLVADLGTGKLIDILYGRFIRNVSVDDADYSEQSVAFEGSFPNLDSGGSTEYEYPFGNYPNQLQWNLALTSLATMTIGFVGQDTDVPSTTRRSGASSAANPLKTTPFNTSADYMRLRIQEVDETGLSTDFKDVTVTFNNNVSGEKVQDYLGSKYLNVGNLEVDLDATLLFTNSDVAAAVRNNTTVQMDFAMRNDNGAIHVDIPSCTLGGGAREFPVNESVRINTTISAFEDSVLGTSAAVSLFPFVPAS